MRHRVEGIAQLLELIAGLDGNALCQVAATDLRRPSCSARIGTIMRRASTIPTVNAKTSAKSSNTAERWMER